MNQHGWIILENQSIVYDQDNDIGFMISDVTISILQVLKMRIKALL